MPQKNQKQRGQPPKRRKRPAVAETHAKSPPPADRAASKRDKPNWQFALVVALIVIPLVGFWLYLKWSAQQIAQSTPLDDQTKSNSSSGTNDGSTSWMEQAPDADWEIASDPSKTWSELDDAARDGWDTEVFANQVSAQLDRFKKLIAHRGAIDAEALRELADDDVSVQQLRPDKPVTTFQSDRLHIQRADLDETALGENRAASASGIESLAAALTHLQAPYSDLDDLRIKSKVFRVEQQDAFITTRQSVEMFGVTADGVLEENAIWIANWRVAEGSDAPKLISLGLLQYESAARRGGTLFSDCTESVVGGNASFQQQLLQGYDHWLGRSQFRRYFSILGNPGLAIGDVNGDGLDDLYLCQESGLPNLLFIQNSDGTLKDESKNSQADWLQSSRTALIVDLDNDGNHDLCVAMMGGVVLAKGDGTGAFSIEQVLDTDDDLMVLNAADYDLDGRLDLYVGAYYAEGVLANTEDTAVGGAGGQFVFYDANDGGRNSLFQNQTSDGQWSFREVTADCGLETNNRRYSLAAAWEDFDNDGDQDLYVANDYGLNNLYRNDLQEDGSRRFVDIAVAAGAQDSASGMSVTWGDYDRDGHVDLYVSNMFSNAGHRIAFQNNFKADASEDVKRRFQRFARGNTLLRNLGAKQSADASHEFDDRSIAAGVNRGRWAWGSRFVDVNNDGWEDLVVANGYITTEDSGDL